MLLNRSELWTIVNSSEVHLADSKVEGLAAWQLKDLKARSDMFLHCGKIQLVSFCPLKTSKVVWDWIKQLYERQFTNP